MAPANDPFGPHLFTPRVMWMALMIANVMVFVVLTVTAQAPSAPPDPIVFLVLAVFATSAGVAHFLIPARTRQAAVASTKLETTEMVDPHASVIFRDAAPRIRVFVDEKAVAAASGQVFQTPFILSIALAESIGIDGGVLVAMGFPVEQAVAFPAIAALLIIRVFPTRKAMLAPLEKHYGATLASDQPAKSQ